METSIIIPAHNEQGNLTKLLGSILKLKRSLRSFETILVDDNSSDNTGAIADRYAKKYKIIKVLHRGRGRNGMGAALKAGTNIAKGRFIIWMMGDNSDDLATIPKFIKQLKNNADIVFGSRYIKGGSSSNLDAYKAMLSKNYTLITQILFGIKVHDITNAFRAFKKEVYSQIRLKSDDFAISPEFAIKAHLRGFKLKEVPTTYKDRQAGKPKFKILKMGIAYCKLFKYRFVSAD
jgi:glycosyltransferase involved in cell wall biosynthesis